MRTILSVWTWVEMTLCSSICFFLILAMRCFIWPFDRQRLITGRAIRLVAVLIVKLNPLWRFRVVGDVPRRSPGKTVCVSNHCSHTDPFLISHIPWEIKWLAKSSLFPIPFVGWGMWLAGDISLVRGSATSAKAAMERCAAYLEQGVPVIIFPEGTRSRDGELLPFKDGAFRLAIRTRANVLPMAVAGTATALRKGDWRPDYSTGLVTIGEPISTQGMTEADVPRLKEQARTAILHLRAKLQAQLDEAALGPAQESRA